MIKLEKKDKIYISVLILFFIFVIFALTRFKYIYGSTIDWEGQHWVFAEYFRNLFYSTHELFPNFAPNIGGGQNIYYFSYYGLFNPLILPAYFLPFVSMKYYMIFVSISTVLASIVLFYIFIKRLGYNSNLCFIVSIIFVCSSPLIFQSHKQIMFITYMPFLLLALIETDNFLDNKKPFKFILYIFLAIMTSFYFTPGIISAVIIYAIFKKYNKNEKTTFKELFKELCRFIVPFTTAILMASLLILPTFVALLSGRGDIKTSENLFSLKLLIPNLNPSKFWYSPDNLGLTLILPISIISGIISKKKKYKIISIIMALILFVPLFTYIMNGTLYLREKAFIPLLPLGCIIIAEFLSDLIENTKISRFLILIPVFVLMCILVYKWDYAFAFILTLD